MNLIIPFYSTFYVFIRSNALFLP